MVKTFLKTSLPGFILFAGLALGSCKSKPKETQQSQDTAALAAPAPVTPAPVEVAQDTELQAGVRDATKDYPGVKADVNNGEITLTGEIKRAKLADLMMTLNSLKPKKINNQLTIK
jgi:hypothetical protein